MKECIYVFLGGGLGSALRYSFSQLISKQAVSCSFPWATFSVNIAGCFLIGVFYELSTRFNLPHEARLLLTVGFCGGFTTFSTFSNEGVELLKSGHYGTFIAYVSLSVLVGVLAAFAGTFIGK